MSAPQLAIIVDAEEEFDWSQPFSRDNQSTASIVQQDVLHKLYDDLGIVPTYVVDYPIVVDSQAVAYLGALHHAGRADIGTHPHPWVTPPHAEEVTAINSYMCNLPVDLQRAKIETLHRAIEAAFGIAPTIFKAGRYGFGPETAKIIADLGYKVDCSHVPHSDFGRDGGPDFRGTPEGPFWLDRDKGLLEIPLTSGFFGAVPDLGKSIARVFDSPRAKRWRIPALLSRSGLVTRARLSPEGISAREQCRLIESLYHRGQRVFTLGYHSPSLLPGHTPYVRDQADLAAFVRTVADVLRWFRDDLGGQFTTLSKIHSLYAQADGPPG